MAGWDPRCRSALGVGDPLEKGEFLKGFAGALGHGAEGILGDVDGEACFLAQESVESLEQGTAASEHDAAIDEVGGEFRRAAFESGADRIDDGAERIGHGFADFL
jgi:hypothetical protein